MPNSFLCVLRLETSVDPSLLDEASVALQALQTGQRLSDRCRWVHGKVSKTKQAGWVSQIMLTITYVTVFWNIAVLSVAVSTNDHSSLCRSELSLCFTAESSWEINRSLFFSFLRGRSLCLKVLKVNADTVVKGNKGTRSVIKQSQPKRK